MRHSTPSERAAELELVVRKMRRQTGLDIVPMLVVEGATDEQVFDRLCVYGKSQVFAAGNRDLVEQLFRHVRANPIDGCRCIYLVDCDGFGKTLDLAGESDLLVTETCDMEADLVELGIARKLTRRFSRSEEQADEFIDRAISLAMPVSIVRRAATSVSISLRRKRRQFRLCEVSDLQLDAWDENTPSPEEVLQAFSGELGWSEADRGAVAGALTNVSFNFRDACLGKDALDSLFRLLKREGEGEVRGWTQGYFFRALGSELGRDDLAAWEVGRRLEAWQEEHGHQLIK